MTKRLHNLSLILLVLCVAGCTDTSQIKTLNRQLQQIGSLGSEEGQFMEPRGLHLTPAGQILATDFRNYRIQLLDLEGNSIEQWGTKGAGPGQFNDPTCAAFDNEGNMFVVDTWNHRIQKRTAEGEWIDNWAQKGDFYAPRGIAIDNQNRVYIANTSLHNIKVFKPTGSLLATWGEAGGGYDQLKDPLGLAFGPDDNLYVADTGNQRIKILNPIGQTLNIIAVPDWAKDQFNEAYIAVGNDKKVYVTVPHQNTVLVYDSTGELFSRFGESGPGPEQLSYPSGIAVNQDGQIYISDALNNRIVKYAPPSPLVMDEGTKANPVRTVLSVLRIIVDVLALSILIIWLVKRSGKKAPEPAEPRKVSKLGQRWAGMLNWFRKRTLILLTLYLSAILCLLAGIFAFTQEKITLGGWLIVSALIMLLIQELPRYLAQVTRQESPRIQRSLFWGLFCLLISVTLFLRVYKLDQVPWGINNDAAWNGMYALRILDGEEYTPFTQEAWGKSTLYFYMIALAFKWFGISGTTLYLPCIMAGFITVLILFLFLKYLFGIRFAFVASFIYSATAWNIVFSRTGYRAILSPICLIFTLWCFYLAADANRWWKRLLCYLVSGFFIGLGLHTYFAFRGIPFMMIIVGIHTWIRKEKFMRRNWWGLLIFLLAGAAAFSPLILYALESPENFESFMGRSDFLFVGNRVKQAGSLAPLWENIKANLLTFNYSANVGNFFNGQWPILSYPLGLLLLLGSGIFLRYFWIRGPFVTCMIFVFGLLPGILSEPDAARAAMTTVSISIFSTAGIFSLVRSWKGRFGKRFAVLIIFLLTSWTCASEFYFYFNTLGNDYFAQFGYAKKHTLIGYKGLELSKENTLYISQGHFIDTPKFICYRVPGDVFMITQGEVIDVVPEDILLANLDAVLTTEHPVDKGLAFVFENDFRNEPLFEQVKQVYPTGRYTEYSDPVYGEEPIFYTYVIPREKLHVSEPPAP
jgi:DNA-binding beta-propeller fold protein YncE/4-amino-4-deoxy-L-arabinose transferase-like glycosyltransferase